MKQEEKKCKNMENDEFSDELGEIPKRSLPAIRGQNHIENSPERLPAQMDLLDDQNGVRDGTKNHPEFRHGPTFHLHGPGQRQSHERRLQSILHRTKLRSFAQVAILLEEDHWEPKEHRL